MDGFIHNDQFLVRSKTEEYKTIYYVSKKVRDVVTVSEKSPSLKIVNTGVRAFSRNDGDNKTTLACHYRLHNEMLSVIRGHQTKRIVYINKSDLKKVFEVEHPRIEELSCDTANIINSFGMIISILTSIIIYYVS